MMAVKDTKKQEFVAAAAAFAALLAERWYEGGGFAPSLMLPPQDLDDNEQMLSRNDVSKMLDVSLSTVDRFVKEKQLTPVRVTGRNPKFRKSDIERFLRRRE